MRGDIWLVEPVGLCELQSGLLLETSDWMGRRHLFAWLGRGLYDDMWCCTGLGSDLSCKRYGCSNDDGEWG